MVKTKSLLWLIEKQLRCLRGACRLIGNLAGSAAWGVEAPASPDSELVPFREVAAP